MPRYKGEIIKEYFYNYELINNDFTIELGGNKSIEVHSNHTEEGWRVTLADTGDKALKGARLKRVEKYIDSDQFMMTYGDGVANIDIHSLLGFHHSHGKLAREGQLMVYKHRGHWACMDTLRDMDYLNKLWNENKAFWKVW